MKKYSDLSPQAREVLREVGNIGTGNAVSAIAQMTGYHFQVRLPRIRIVDYREAPEILGGAETLKAGILMGVSGELSGMFMFLMSEDFTRSMLSVLLDRDSGGFTELDEMDVSALSEVGNIMCGSYVNALSKLLGMSIQVSVPDFCFDMAGALLSVPMIHFANLSDELLVIENQFFMSGRELTSHVLFMPELESLEKIFKALGV